MHLQVQLHGRTPLLMHNVRLVDPDDPVVAQIATITSKKKKTKQDRADINRLEWFGGIYADENGPYIPTANIRRCLQEAGKIDKQGKNIVRAVIMHDLVVPLDHKGPRDIEELFEIPEHTFRVPVGISNKKMMRTRPMFPQWSVSAEMELLEDVMDLAQFQAIADRAGRAEGLGDNRVNGYGRFTVEVRVL